MEFVALAAPRVKGGEDRAWDGDAGKRPSEGVWLPRAAERRRRIRWQMVCGC